MANTSHGHDEHHGLAHVLPVKLLVGVFLALLALTVVTVSATSIDLGPRVNLIIAMAIATAKAALVCLYFMHLKYDRKFNLLIFMGSLLFVGVFVSATMVDTAQYQHDLTPDVSAQP